MTLSSLANPYRAVVFGASGGIGAALVRALDADPRCGRIFAGARRNLPQAAKIEPFTLDLGDEPSIRAAAALAGDVDLVIVATGVLHNQVQQPEKSFRALDGDALARSFATNTIGPALVAKHFLPILRRDAKSVFAALSARVGSISDNRLGGWHGYRASKAALNMMIRTCAIELARRNPTALCVALHPGTVETKLAQPFLSGVSATKRFTPADSAERLLSVIDRLSAADSGAFFAWDGTPIPY